MARRGERRSGFPRRSIPEKIANSPRGRSTRSANPRKAARYPSSAFANAWRHALVRPPPRRLVIPNEDGDVDGIGAERGREEGALPRKSRTRISPTRRRVRTNRHPRRDRSRLTSRQPPPPRRAFPRARVSRDARARRHFSSNAWTRDVSRDVGSHSIQARGKHADEAANVVVVNPSAPRNISTRFVVRRSRRMAATHGGLLAQVFAPPRSSAVRSTISDRASGFAPSSRTAIRETTSARPSAMTGTIERSRDKKASRGVVFWGSQPTEGAVPEDVRALEAMILERLHRPPGTTPSPSVCRGFQTPRWSGRRKNPKTWGFGRSPFSRRGHTALVHSGDKRRRVRRSEGRAFGDGIAVHTRERRAPWTDEARVHERRRRGVATTVTTPAAAAKRQRIEHLTQREVAVRRSNAFARSRFWLAIARASRRARARGAAVPPRSRKASIDR